MRPVQDLAKLASRHAIPEGTRPLPVPRLSLIHSSRAHEPVQVLHQPALCLIVQGRKQVALGERVFVYDPANYLIISVALPVTGEILSASESEPYLCLRLDLDLSVLTGLLPLVPEQPDDGSGGMGVTLQPVTPELLDAVYRLVRLLDTPEDIPVLAPVIEREVLYRAMKVDPLLRAVARADGIPSRVGRALNWLMGNYAARFSMKALAEEARMSPSALHKHFRAVTTMSPLQYQKQLRLQEARRLMRSQGVGAGQAAFTVGYESASQFSREYRRQFGASPAEDARRQRGLAGT